MVQVDIEYQGALRCAATHGPSRTQLETDAPVDNRGRGERFSPTDLLATALGTCMATIMGIRARDRGADLEGMQLVVEKHMAPELPRRVGRLVAAFTIPTPIAARFDAEARAALEQAALTCPVALSLAPAIAVETRFDWQ